MTEPSTGPRRGRAGDAAAAARAWLRGEHRTWRWNDGSYRAKNRYDAVETSDQGLVWFGFDGAAQGFSYREVQAFADFLERGACRAAPADVLQEVTQWLRDRAVAAGE